MGHSPDAYLFYGYTLSDDFELPDSASDTFLRDGEPVRIGFYGYKSSTPYVEITSTAARASDYGPEKVDLLGLIAALPDDAEDQLRAFATAHGLPQPGERIDPDSEYDDETASEVGWWLAAQYG